MARKSTNKTEKRSGAPSKNCIAHWRLDRLRNGDPKANNFRNLVRAMSTCYQASMSMDLPQRCDIARCRRHRCCTFDYLSPTLPAADPVAWNHMEAVGVPLCIAQNFEAFQRWIRQQ